MIWGLHGFWSFASSFAGGERHASFGNQEEDVRDGLRCFRYHTLDLPERRSLVARGIQQLLDTSLEYVEHRFAVLWFDWSNMEGQIRGGAIILFVMMCGHVQRKVGVWNDSVTRCLSEEVRGNREHSKWKPRERRRVLSLACPACWSDAWELASV